MNDCQCEGAVHLRQRGGARGNARTLRPASLFLLHGPAGVGKSLLLAAVCPKLPDVLYSALNSTPQVLYKSLAGALFAARDPLVTRACSAGVSSLQERKTAVALKGIVRDALRNSNYVVVLDHLARPSQSLAASVRELMVDCSLPVVGVSRSAHMEDAGFLLQLFPDRAEKFALRNFDSDTSSTVRSVVWTPRRSDRRQSGAVPGQGRSLQRRQSRRHPMILLAKLPRYTRGGQIKTAPLYIDFKLAMVSQ